MTTFFSDASAGGRRGNLARADSRAAGVGLRWFKGRESSLAENLDPAKAVPFGSLKRLSPRQVTRFF